MQYRILHIPTRTFIKAGRKHIRFVNPHEAAEFITAINTDGSYSVHKGRLGGGFTQ
jgi:hypothetical protein